MNELRTEVEKWYESDRPMLRTGRDFNDHCPGAAGGQDILQTLIDEDIRELADTARERPWTLHQAHIMAGVKRIWESAVGFRNTPPAIVQSLVEVRKIYGGIQASEARELVGNIDFVLLTYFSRDDFLSETNPRILGDAASRNIWEAGFRKVATWAKALEKKPGQQVILEQFQKTVKILKSEAGGKEINQFRVILNLVECLDRCGIDPELVLDPEEAGLFSGWVLQWDTTALPEHERRYLHARLIALLGQGSGKESSRHLATLDAEQVRKTVGHVFAHPPADRPLLPVDLVVVLRASNLLPAKDARTFPGKSADIVTGDSGAVPDFVRLAESYGTDQRYQDCLTERHFVRAFDQATPGEWLRSVPESFLDVLATAARWPTGRKVAEAYLKHVRDLLADPDQAATVRAGFSRALERLDRKIADHWKAVVDEKEKPAFSVESFRFMAGVKAFLWQRPGA
ncbi:MAG: hypothetical protein M3O22_00770 [Pseudomonadota bacterium]|nr:hypothetical protein [Pseudomonadota bacterium]